MFEKVLLNLTAIFQAMPFSGATWFTLGTIVFFTWIFAKASKDPLNPIKWEHLVIDSDNNRASPYKLGYLIGVIISTWVVIRFADRQTLNFDILGMYLTYLVTGAGVNSFVKSKTPGMDRIETTVVQTTSSSANAPVVPVLIPTVDPIVPQSPEEEYNQTVKSKIETQV